jgi:putative spermidine/putrescine transport system ATP-binding protein
LDRSVLPILAGRMRPDSGLISLGKSLWFQGDGRRSLEIQDRPVGYVSERDRLTPARNVALTLSSVLSHWPTQTRGIRVAELLDKVGLTPFARLRYWELEPDQRWRLALVRALAPRPQIVLLEEPFEGLGKAAQRLRIRLLRELLIQEGTSALVATTHAQVLAGPQDSVLKVEPLVLRGVRSARPRAVAVA